MGYRKGTLAKTINNIQRILKTVKTSAVFMKKPKKRNSSIFSNLL